MRCVVYRNVRHEWQWRILDGHVVIKDSKRSYSSKEQATRAVLRQVERGHIQKIEYR